MFEELPNITEDKKPLKAKSVINTQDTIKTENT